MNSVVSIRPYTTTLALSDTNLKIEDDPELIALSQTQEYIEDTIRNRLYQNGMLLEFEPDWVKNNLELVLFAVENDERSMQFASIAVQKEIQTEIDTAIIELKKDGLQFDNLLHWLQTIKSVILAAVQQNGLVTQFLSERFSHDKDIALAALDTHIFWNIANFADDVDVMQKAIAINPSARTIATERVLTILNSPCAEIRLGKK